MSTLVSNEVYLEPSDNKRLASLCGPLDDNIKQIERRLGVEITYRNNEFKIIGESIQTNGVAELLKLLYIETQPVKSQIPILEPEQVHLAIQEAKCLERAEAGHYSKEVHIKTKRGVIKPRNPNQSQYVSNIVNHDITFGVGPAGTGKTYLAVACAVDALERQEIRRILLTRPAVEAGEKLGFLPGDLAQKVDPYLRPLYDALFEMLGFERVEKLIERNVIEVAPLAYMRGRTLNDAFIILDESQNTTVEQMKMFLTRIGFNSRAVITGDITQIDLPRGVRSGLRHTIEVLKDVQDISFNFFTANDVVRHPVVARIVRAYEEYEKIQDEKIRQVSVNLDYQIAIEDTFYPAEQDVLQWLDLVLINQSNQDRDLTHSEITVRVVSQQESQSLNHQYRGKDKPTNVLSFPFEAPAQIQMDLLGDLVICADIVEKESKLQNKPIAHHWAHMIIHGTLHLLGFDHVDEQDAQKMEILEVALLAKLAIDDPYKDH